MSWIQASKALPCPICGSTHYCSLKPDSGIVKCTKVSERSFAQKKDAAGVGFFHRHQFDDSVKISPPPPPVPIPSWDKVVELSLTAPRRHFRPLSRLLGCDIQDMLSWEIGFLSQSQLQDAGTSCSEYGAWTFPMRDHEGTVVGIRLRSPSGFKYAIRGSRNGLFYQPRNLQPGMPVLVVDGATDAFVGWRNGLNIVGRPSSTTGNESLLKLFESLKPMYVDQLLDKDNNQNREHARDTATELVANIHHGSIFYPQKGKDLREWLLTVNSLPSRLSRLAALCGTTAKSSRK